MRALFSLLFLICFTFSFSQVKPLDSVKTESEVVEDIEKANVKMSPKYKPSKAGLYAAVLPGLGQYYNKKYWKIPIVWGAVGTGVGIIVYNDKQYKRYKTAFAASLNGEPHEFSDIPGIDKVVLGNVQDQAKRYRDYAIAITGVVYILNILDAVVDAHLYEQKRDPDLVIRPTLVNDQQGLGYAKAGLSLQYRF